MGETQVTPAYRLLWAKTSKDETQTHPLICHMVDVAEVALALWDMALTASIRRQVADALSLEDGSARMLVAFWAGMHDLGKACPSFQRKHDPTRRELSTAGLAFPDLFVRGPFQHGTGTARLLPPLLQTECGLSRPLAQAVARVLGGHHGVWPVAQQILDLGSRDLGRGAWDDCRGQLFCAVKQLLDPPVLAEHVPHPAEHNPLLILLSGLTSIADWIGSMEDSFRFAPTVGDLCEYRERARLQALQALAQLGWTAWQPPTEPRSFEDLFRLNQPRAVQAVAVQLASRLNKPALVIIEAETGTGKTEAALYLADYWARTLQQRGLYVAMPTMATSNQMHARVCRMLAHRYDNMPVEALLIHGQSQWAKEAPPPDVNVAPDEGQAGEGGAESMGWFLPRKRSLLAPFGVGTVDQALISVLQTRHFFVRLLGLSHKTVVFDEVHAYDTYMTTLFRHLLSWLRALGTSVVLLSATLPARTRSDLLEAYSGVAAGDVPAAPYPAITWAMKGQVGLAPISPGKPRELELNWIGREPAQVVSLLTGLLEEGGCAAVVCNTVARAQEVYGALRDARVVPDGQLHLFHARFPMSWRRRIEDWVVEHLGATGDRPRVSIVVATQVIEQSLDLDFDVMISDMAPVDLIIQRAGRLHRHAGRTRPGRLAAPRLALCEPDLEGGVPRFGVDRYVYEEYVLLRSYMTLRLRQRIELPGDTRPLIEAVYGQGEQDSGFVESELARAAEQMDANQANEQFEARQRLIGSPLADNLLNQSNAGLDEDSPGLHRTLQALTRLGPPSLTVVCLHRVGDRLNTEPDGCGVWVDLDIKPCTEMTQKLVHAAVAISHPGIFHALLEQPAPAAWRDHPLLKGFRCALFADGCMAVPRTHYTLRLTRHLGLEVCAEPGQASPGKEGL